uniref:Uncharacterized protein n=1 Tax=Aliarcobacter butzleri TaxID=28197 RepID=W0LZU9_9BACT|nr:hypothetical protein [Aliarcobacter butzleri]AHG28742.1 hypothetical protein [Aliarcobacter butzleri]
MLTVICYFINNGSSFENFKIFSNISEIEQEEYYIYFNREYPSEKVINIKELRKYEIYSSGCLIKSADFEN